MFLIAGIVAVVFFLIKFIYSRFISKEQDQDQEPKPLKSLIMDSIIVFIASVLAIMLQEQFGLAKSIMSNSNTTNVFVSEPEF